MAGNAGEQASADLGGRSNLGEASTAGGARRLYRSRSNRVLAGVCGGLAEYYAADVSAVRLVTVVVALFTAFIPMFVLYLIAAIVIPERVDGEMQADNRQPGIAVAPGRGALVLGILLVGIGVMALANELLTIDWDVLWPVGLILAGGVLIFAVRRR